MKRKNRNWIAVMITVLLCAAFAATALAAGDTMTREERLQQRQQTIEEAQGNVAQRQEQIESKMGEFSEFRQQVEALRLSILENRAKNLALASQNNALRLNTLQAIQSIKDSGATLPEETVTELRSLNEQVKAIVSELKDTRGDIREIAQANKDHYRAKDYEAMVAAFAQIEQIQSNRYELLIEMQDVLQQMNQLVASAA